MASLYDADKKLEEYFGEWLDEHFYSNGSKEWTFKRITDASMQKKGIDVQMTLNKNGHTYNIDEKSALHYINRGINTFAFELKNRKSGARGWLYNPSYLTHFYLLCWPNGNTPIKSKDDFTSSEIMFIQRSNVIKMLNDKGFTEAILNKKIEEFLPSVTEDNCKFELADGIYLRFTEKLYEKPVNLLIEKRLLETIASTHKNIK